MKKSITAFLVFYALALTAQFGGTIFTSMGVTDWYLTLNRSALTPPGYVFGLVCHFILLQTFLSTAAVRSEKINVKLSPEKMPEVSKR